MKFDLKAALQILDSGQWVSISFFTADVLKGKGGLWIEIQKCRVLPRDRVKAHNTFEKSGNGTYDFSKKAQNHNTHFTRNVQLLNKDFRKIHPILITHINNTELI